ncbi:TetR family transcriptional regulator [Streptomyces sp. NPDC006923]|uniref:TetR/AcrR family transcriptional regulator n=1 Tax=Streptomyces sp. NPDC006923 TaxID=3155355 RepID=UPI0033F2238F
MAVKARLNRETLVSTALDLADAEGLDAVTTRRVAQHHGVTPMALYRHFRDKEEIFDALAERLLAQVALPEPDHRPWHEQTRDVFDAFLAALRPHPAVAGLVLNRVLTSEPGLALAERTLSLLAEGGFPVDQAAETGSQALCSLVTLVITEPGRGDGPDPETRDGTVRAKRAALAALPPRRYPHVVAAADALASCASDDVYYARGTAMIVAGIRSGPATADRAATGG